jgi:hypothetical protein
MLRTACKLLASGPEVVPDGLVHRLDKFDTAQGMASISHAAQQHVPYAVLLYECLGGLWSASGDIAALRAPYTSIHAAGSCR